MLDSSMRNQLSGIFSGLTNEYIFEIQVSPEHESRKELLEAISSPVGCMRLDVLNYLCLSFRLPGWQCSIYWKKMAVSVVMDIIMRFIRITMTNIRKKSLLWIFVYLLNRYNREGGCIICLWHMNNTDQADLHGFFTM